MSNQIFLPVFCGREEELKILQDAWGKVSADQPKPQLIVLLAESGLGKTRLVQEFYKWLSTHHDGIKDKGYWSDTLETTDKNKGVNPNISECNTKHTIPFIWWGMRLSDLGKHNQAGGAALPTYLNALKLHLEPMYQARSGLDRKNHKRKIVGKTIADFIPGVGNVLGIVDADFELSKIKNEAKNEIDPTNLNAIKSKQSKDIIQSALHDLEIVLSGKKRKIPTVIFIDDAQFSQTDPSITKFVSDLLDNAFKKNWPLLILVTHWEAEWNKHQGTSENSIAGSIIDRKHLLEENWAPLPLSNKLDLLPMLQENLPGIGTEQKTALLDKVGGNPLYLFELIQLCLRSEGFFIDRDIEKAMTEDGIKKLLSEKTTISTVILERFRLFPEAIQQSLVLASLQGMDFATSLLKEVADILHIKDINEGLIKAENPHAFVSGAKLDIATFTQRIHHETAAGQLRHKNDPEKVKDALQEVIRTRVQDDTLLEKLSINDKRNTLALTIELFADTQNLYDLRLVIKASIILGIDAQSQFDYLGSIAKTGRLIEILKRADTQYKTSLPVEFQNNLAAVYINRGNVRQDIQEFSEALEDYGNAITIQEALRKTLGNKWPGEFQNDLANAYMNRGTTRARLQDFPGAIEDYSNAITVMEDPCNTLGNNWQDKFQNDLASAYINRGTARAKSQNFPEAIKDYGSAITIREALRDTLGDNWPSEFQNDLAKTYMNRGNVR